MIDLGRDEEIVTQAKVHWACLIPHILLLFVYGLGIITGAPVLIRMFTTDMYITSKRLYGKVGLINTKTLDTPLNKVNTVSIESGLLGKILGYGTIHITSSSGSYEFKSIKSPEVFKAALLEEIDKFDEKRIKKQATEMAAAMKS
ncbi:PH domain-containing protein [Oscillibacter sp.]|uniref:PH domain-containing protein n=1 Tax=Oscillibacter sp. TaxID=1945593 RepID=UPI00289D02A4|nr:PH domain-containing protein [Oscillibacter sp.]